MTAAQHHDRGALSNTFRFMKPAAATSTSRPPQDAINYDEEVDDQIVIHAQGTRASAAVADDRDIVNDRDLDLVLNDLDQGLENDLTSE